MEINRGSVEDIEVARARRAWESATRHVTRLYAELEKAIAKAADCEHAYNVAQRAAKLRDTNVGAAALVAVAALADLVA